MKEELTHKRENFSNKMAGILNNSAINLAMAIGYRTGLFDVMDTFDDPCSLEGIAAKANVNPRYLREWLGIMVTGEIVELSQGKDGENLGSRPRHKDTLGN